MNINTVLSLQFAHEVGAEKKECFRNGILGQQHLAAIGIESIYVEGYAVPHNLDIPFEHAWLIVDGEIVDITWVLNDVKHLHHNIYCESQRFTIEQVEAIMAEYGELRPPLCIRYAEESQRNNMSRHHHFASMFKCAQAAAVRDIVGSKE